MIDEVEIKLIAGKGGDGLISFRREKYVDKGGPDGGDGGNGGSIIFKSQDNLQDLSYFSLKKEFIAENGENGKKKRMHGRNGKDLILNLPKGTQIYQNGKLIADFVTDRSLIICKGGNGGWGNWHFATSTNQTPRRANRGLPGEEKTNFLELKLIADVGIIGLPNAGKSTLLSKLTNARPKIGSWMFTTLKPNLGSCRIGRKTIIIADIPGLIAGASRGKGLGDKFLRHIERTKRIIHLIDAQSQDWQNDWDIINNELNLYSSVLAKLKQIVVINKIDLIDQPDQKNLAFVKARKAVLISAQNMQSQDIVSTLLK